MLLSAKHCLSLVQRASCCIRYASSFDAPSPKPNFNAFREQNSSIRSQPLGDQKTHYFQHRRQFKRIGGDTQFYKGQRKAEDDLYRQGNVSGFSGRGRLPPLKRGRGMEDIGMSLRPVKWDQNQLKSFNKNFYSPCEAVISRGQSEIDEWLQKNNCILQGEDLLRPVFSFEECGFPDVIMDHVGKNFNNPTPIQCVAWPAALSGKDMISIAMTGSGKTLGFILPAIVHIMGQSPRQRGEGPSVLVLAPTRELAKQVDEVARTYCDLLGLKVACCYGGAAKSVQGQALHQGVDICVATPGRITDFLEARATNMNRCTYLVLDEADRMLDMGFEPQIRKIISQIRPDRQTLMFSATWPVEVRKLAADFLNNEVFLNVGSLDLAANHNILQHVEVIDEYSKEDRLFELLNEHTREPDCKALIFAQTKRKVDELTTRMRRAGLPVLCIHGDKSQSERDWVLDQFRGDKIPILVATDVAARGLDVNNIKYIINFDYPNDAEDYIHRIGRTARQNKTGTSYTFFTPQDAPKANGLVKVLEEANQIVPDQLRQLNLQNRTPPVRRRFNNNNRF